MSLSDLQRPPFSLPRTVAPLQGPPFPRPHGLRPLRFCITAQLPRTRLSLRGPPVPSGSLAACSLLLQVAFIGFSLGDGVLSCFHGNCYAPRKPGQLLAARAGSCWPSLPHSLESENMFHGLLRYNPSTSRMGSTPLTPQRLTLLVRLTLYRGAHAPEEDKRSRGREEACGMVWTAKP